jgi:hypothetical protein
LTEYTKDLFSITVRLTEKDPLKLYSPENREKLELCAEAIEIGIAISLAVSGVTSIEHQIFVNEDKMQVSLVYCIPENSCDAKMSNEFFKSYGMEKERLHENFEQSKRELADEGIELETKIVSIQTLKIPR